ncbi:MAG: methyltransferase, TIGR04325 family [Imperialibacter sp.]|uniref:methyltransferase, TIGR04325 family n=1 Tax=Imperialibacter sp. TaxID=2038411 RepID=UPI0032EEE944
MHLFKSFTPPFIWNVLKDIKTSITKEGWHGDYKTWGEAVNFSSGYGSTHILTRCKEALLKVKNGEAVYERDGVLFDHVHYSWGLLAGLLKVALENGGNLHVLDFGGSLGSTYFQNKGFLNSLKELRWNIVEQQHFVDCGQAYFEDKNLRFFHSVEEYIAESTPDVLLLSSVLQYLPKPYEWIEKFGDLGISHIILDRTAFIDSEMDIITIQRVNEPNFETSYPAWFFNEQRIIDAWSKKGYSIVAKFDSDITPPSFINKRHFATWKGIFLEKIESVNDKK